MKKKIVLFLLSLVFVTKSFGEGQDGLGIFIAIFYLLSILFYTLVGFFIIKIALTILKSKASHSNWLYIAISFFISILLALIIGDNFIPFFW